MNEWNKFKKAVATNKMEKKVVIFFQKLHQNKIIEWKMNEKKITKTHWTYGSFFSVWKRIYSFFVLFCFNSNTVHLIHFVGKSGNIRTKQNDTKKKSNDHLHNKTINQNIVYMAPWNSHCICRVCVEFFFFLQFTYYPCGHISAASDHYITTCIMWDFFLIFFSFQLKSSSSSYGLFPLLKNVKIFFFIIIIIFTLHSTLLL